MRGKLFHLRTPKIVIGITPAGAGKTPAETQERHAREDHPRRCGENPVLHDFRAVSTGSPPQVRGKLLSGTPRKQLHGITPAGAGKTRLHAATSPLRTDHPRRCGENHVAPEYRYFLCRITPAGAGKTQTGTPLGVFLRDHPRRCGENLVESCQFPPF